MKIGIEIPEELVCLIDAQAKDDGHDNRDAVIQKALVSFFAEKVAFVAKTGMERKIHRDKSCPDRTDPVPGLSMIAQVKRLQDIANFSELCEREKR